MDAEQVVTKILSEAKAQAEAIVSETKAKVSTQKSELDKELAEFAADTKAKAEKAATETKEQMLAKARMDVRKEYLTAKVALLDELFASAIDKVNGMESKSYTELMTKLMVKAVEDGSEEVLVGKDDSRIDNELIKQVNRELGTGYKGNLRLAADSANIAGGFVLRRGNIRINVSTDVLVGQVRDKLEMELAEELFS